MSKQQPRTKQRGGGELESAAMRSLWDSGRWMTAAEVQQALGGDLAYNTVLTILVRLWEKGRLERRRDGKSHLYKPLMSRDEYTAARLSSVLGEASDRSAAMVGFIESLPDDDRMQLRRMLGRARRRT